jgi:hypothetical protein
MKSMMAGISKFEFRSKVAKTKTKNKNVRIPLTRNIVGTI